MQKGGHDLHLSFIVLLPLIFSFVPIILYRYWKQVHTGIFTLIIPVVCAIYFILEYKQILNKPISEIIYWMPELGINLDLRVDGLSLLFSLLITIIGSAVVLYSIFYLNKKEHLGRFYTYLLLFMGAMLGVVNSNNVYMLYFFWELTSISSFLLISFWFTKDKSIYGAMKSMLITVFGGLMLLGAILILVNITHTTSIINMLNQADKIQDHPMFLIALIMILLAAFTKSAQFPFHIWLPDAMEAPTPVSAYLHSATMVKAGLFLIARFTPIFATSSVWTYALIFVGLWTMAYASFNAVFQKDLKGLLAYSTISQLGLIMSLLGFGALSFNNNQTYFYMAITASVFHIINHASFKGALFMAVGIIDHETGTRDIKKLYGLISVMPITFTITMLGCLSMAGVPPFNGFLSKEMLLTAGLHALNHPLINNPILQCLYLVLMIGGSIFTFVYSLRFIKNVFTGQLTNETPKKPHEATKLFLMAPMMLIGIMMIISVFPNLLLPLLQNSTNSIIHKSVSVDAIHHFHGINLPLMITLIIIIIGCILVMTTKWQVMTYPERFKINTLYDGTGKNILNLSNRINESLIYTTIRFSMLFIFSTLIIISVLSLMTTDFNIHFEKLSPVTFYEAILILITLIAAVMLLIARSRLFSIIMLSTIGYSVALFFVFFDAPDLALTQLSIETISTALFLLCFYHLPKHFKYEKTKKFRAMNALIAVGVGFSVVIITLMTYSHPTFSSISDYYKKHVYDLAAGKNMVNVILVDFRGFDTLFESSVLGIAGIGIYTIIRLRKTGGVQNEETRK